MRYPTVTKGTPPSKACAELGAYFAWRETTEAFIKEQLSLSRPRPEWAEEHNSNVLTLPNIDGIKEEAIPTMVAVLVAEAHELIDIYQESGTIYCLIRQ